MPQFLLDTNFFIQSHMQYLPLDIALSFWDKIDSLATKGKIASIDKVYNEIAKYEGAVKKWVNDYLPFEFFQETNSCINEYMHLMQWAQQRSNHYLPQAISDFADINRADAWLIAMAQHTNVTVVTYEVANPKLKKAIKIPDVCSAFNIPCTNLKGMFRSLGETF